MGQQAVEQQHVAAGPDRQMQVGGVACGGTARVDHDDAGAAFRLGSDKALVEDGMAPCEVAADQNHQIGKLQILVIAGNHVAAKGAAVAGDAGRHAQAGIGVDIGAADEAFHQLVGDVIVFGQQLAGDVEGDRVGAVFGDHFAEAGGYGSERFVPGGLIAVHLRVEQPAFQTEGFTQGAPLGAEPAEIGRVLLVTGNGPAARTVG
jgi:hypothetical protein